MGTIAEADQGARTAETEPDMRQAGMPHALGRVLDAARAETVFGQPVTQSGATVIPVARVKGRGGGGGGAGPQDGRAKRGRGGGFGLSARPVGAFVIKSGGKVTWRPSVDINRIVMGGQILAGIAVLASATVRRLRRA
jgi:uncharacterized spore protein YtfJ